MLQDEATFSTSVPVPSHPQSVNQSEKVKHVNLSFSSQGCVIFILVLEVGMNCAFSGIKKESVTEETKSLFSLNRCLLGSQKYCVCHPHKCMIVDQCCFVPMATSLFKIGKMHIHITHENVPILPATKTALQRI